MRFRNFAIACIAVLCTLLVSCIDGHEEIWLNADGSGHADLAYDIPANAAKFHGGAAGVQELVDSLLENQPDAFSEVVEKDGRLKVHVKVRFKSAGELSKLTHTTTEKKTPAAFENLAGKFELKRSLNQVDFTRTISPGKALPGGFIPAAQFKNRNLTYIIHLPVVPENSTATRTADGGKTLIWEQPLATAMRQPIVIHFKAAIPIPSWIFATAALAIAIFGLIVVKLLQRRRRRS
jgi:hypothetical protein